MLKKLKNNKMSVVATGILFGVMGVLIIAFIGMLLAISLFCVVIKHQMSFLVIVACLAITLCDTIKNR